MLPTITDLRIASLVHDAAAAMPATGRWGDGKVFIWSIWQEIVDDGNNPWPDNLLVHARRNFDSWLLRAMRLTDSEGAPLVILARADLVAATDVEVVAASEISLDGCAWHFVIDRAADPLAYAERASRAVQPDPYDRARQILASEARRLRSGEGGHGGRSHAAIELADAIDQVLAGPGAVRGQIVGRV